MIKESDKSISLILFTKNRPLQLHGYLESLYRFFPVENIQIYILYKPELFSEEYELVFKTFPECIIVREKDFYKDFIEIFSSVKTKYIFFGIDDVVYFDGIRIDIIDETFQQLESSLFGFSLRLDKRQMPEDFEASNVKEYDIHSRTIYLIN